MEQPPVSLTEARERLARHDQVALRVKEAENQVGKLKAEIKDLDRKQAWGAKVRADTIEKLGKVYREPEAALKAIKAEMVWNGSGQTTAKLERTPEAFGKLHGWRVAGGLLTSQPWTILASAERREAVSHAQDAARQVRMLAGAERAVSAAMAGKPELVGKLAAAERDAERRQAEIGPIHRYQLMRDVERLERTATAAARSVPNFAPGDTLKINVKVIEGNRERVQAYEGVCIARNNDGLNSSFVLRMVSYGEGVERIFPLYSPNIASFEVVRRGDVRGAKQYYQGERCSKSARIAEQTTGHSSKVAASKHAQSRGRDDPAPER